MDEKKFIERVNLTLAKELEHRWGNNILYGICKEKDYPWEQKNILADKIWLIGRSYAASPERRYIGSSGKDIEFHGDGTGDFFIHFAERLLKRDEYKALVSTIREFKALEFDNSEDDIKKLRDTVTCVMKFNSLIKGVLKEFDNKVNPKASNLQHRNHVSFCSKFIHFHVPNSVFIFDHYTEEGGKTLMGANRRKGWQWLDVPISSDETNFFKPLYQDMDNRVGGMTFTGDEKEQDYGERYRQHCIREYIISYYIKEHLDLIDKEKLNGYPRLADSIFQRIQEQKNNHDLHIV